MPPARIALALALGLSSTGCFTSWAMTQAFGGQRVHDESVREQVVPLPGVEEKLAVSVPLEPEYTYERDPNAPPVDAATAAYGTTTPPPIKKPRPLQLACSTTQHARDRVYHSAFRYGSRWKKLAGSMFLVEAALGSLFLLLDQHRDTSDPMKANDRSGLLAGGFFAVDAVGTAAIFFIPRKEIYSVDDKPIVTPIRKDCPDGLVLEIAGDAYPVDAAGGIGDVGELALDDWMRAPAGTLALTFAGRALPLQVGAREQCAWMRARHPEEPNTCGTSTQLPRTTTAIIVVPTGTLTAAPAP